MRKKLSQLNIHVPWLQGNPPRTTSVVGLGLVLSINVAKMEWETRDVRSSWDIYIYIHIYQVNQFDQMHILYTFIIVYLLYSLHLLTWIILNPPLSQCKWCHGLFKKWIAIHLSFSSTVSMENHDENLNAQNWNSDSATVMTYCWWYPHGSQMNPKTSSN